MSSYGLCCHVLASFHPRLSSEALGCVLWSLPALRLVRAGADGRFRYLRNRPAHRRCCQAEESLGHKEQHITARHVMDQAPRIRPDGRAKLMTEPYQAHDRSP